MSILKKIKAFFVRIYQKIKDFFKHLKTVWVKKIWSPFVRRMRLIWKYLVKYPLRALALLVCAILIIIGIVSVWHMLFGRTKLQNATPALPVLSQTQKEVQEQKRFDKDIKLSHADVQEPEEKQTEEAEVTEEKTLEPKKYAVWNINKEEIAALKERESIGRQDEEESFVPEEITVQPQEQKAPAKKVKHKKKNKPKVLYHKLDDAGLEYLNAPLYVSGEAVVYGPNEIYIGETYVYLYGIDTDEIKYDAKKTTEYLRDLVALKNVTCQIVAYTPENIASAVCFVDGKMLNRLLIDEKMADNLAF